MSSGSTGGYRPGFAVNTLWQWTSTVANLSMAIVVSPLLIRRLGDEAYGLWAIVFSIAEYYTLFDLGVRSAVVKYVAQHWALGEQEELNRTLNTAFAYLVGMGSALLVVTLVLAPLGPHFFVISPGMRDTFVYVLLITGVGWAVSLLFMCFAASLEAVQRFDVSNRIVIITNTGRVAGVVALLQLGFGLKAVVTVAVGARLLQCALLWRAFGRHFPNFRWTLTGVNRATFHKLFRFSVHTIPATIGYLLLDQGPGLVIGHVLPARFVGYYSLPRRLIQSVLDLVYRLGLVTNSRAAELVAHQQQHEVIRLGIQSNRYSLVVFMPATVFLAVYGDALFRVWLTPQFAAASAPLLPVFLAGALFAEAAQFNSVSILYALAKHRFSAWALLAESLISMALIYHYVQEEALWSAAALSSVIMFLNRGCLTPILLCRHFEYPVRRYVAAIVSRPLAVGGIVAATIWLCRMVWLPGNTLFGIALGGALSSLFCLIGAGRYCLTEEHQITVLDAIRQNAPSFHRSAHRWFGVRHSEAH
jgi:O-antigen/teichoic acid export membrane protein